MADASNDAPIKTADRGDWTVIRITEASLMDTAVIEQVNEAIQGKIQAGRRNLILDFKYVEYISSSMIGTLVGAAQNTKKAKGQLILCAVSDKLQELLKLMRLDKMFRVEQDARTALKQVGAVE